MQLSKYQKAQLKVLAKHFTLECQLLETELMEIAANIGLANDELIEALEKYEGIEL